MSIHYLIFAFVFHLFDVLHDKQNKNNQHNAPKITHGCRKTVNKNPVANVLECEKITEHEIDAS